MGSEITDTKPRRHYNTELGQMVWMPRKLYGWLRKLAAAEHRTISRQLELIVAEWKARALSAEGRRENGQRAARLEEVDNASGDRPV